MQVRTTGIDEGYRLVDKETGNDAIARRKENGKFDITIDGETYYNNSLRDCKQLLVEPREEHCTDETGDEEDGGAWGCCHPCAMLVELLAISEDRINASPDFQKYWPEIRRTLDSYGYLTRDGEIDADAARREIDHWLARGAEELPADQPSLGD